MWERSSALKAIGSNTVKFGDRHQLIPYLTESDRKLIAEIHSIDYFPCALPRHSTEQFKELLSGMDEVFYMNALPEDKKVVTLILMMSNDIDKPEILCKMYDYKVIKYLFDYIVNSNELVYNDYIKAISRILRSCMCFGKYRGLSAEAITMAKMGYETIEMALIIGEFGGHRV